MDPKMTVQEAATFLNISGQAVLKKLKCCNLFFKKTQNRVHFGHKTSKEVFKIEFIPKIITIQVVKGGTGKTALAQAISIRANLYGARVLCIDLDQQANLTQSFNLDPNNYDAMIEVIKDKKKFNDNIISIYDGLDLFPSNLRNAMLEDTLMLESLPIDRIYEQFLTPLKSKYDLILIDCPPALGRSVGAASLASDCIICPVTPEQSSVNGLNITFGAIKNLERKFKKTIDFKIVQNKFDCRTSLSRKILTTLINDEEYKDCIFNSYVRQTQDFPNTFSKGISIFDTLKPSYAKEDIDLLTQEILGIIPVPVKLDL